MSPADSVMIDVSARTSLYHFEIKFLARAFAGHLISGETTAQPRRRWLDDLAFNTHVLRKAFATHRSFVEHDPIYSNSGCSSPAIRDEAGHKRSLRYPR